MSQALVDRYQAQIAGVLSCYDRVVVTGTLPHICYPEGMTRYLHGCEVPIFEFPAFAQTLRDRLRERAEKLAAEAGIAVEYIGHRGVRKEEVVAPSVARTWRSSGPGARALGYRGLHVL